MKNSTYYNHEHSANGAVIRAFENGTLRVEQDGLVMMEINRLHSLNYRHDFDGISIEADVHGDPVEAMIEAKALRDVLLPNGFVRVEKVIIEDAYRRMPWGPGDFRY